MEKLSANLTMEKFIYSDTARAKGIDNTLPPALVSNAVRFAENVYEPLYQKFGSALQFSSLYRCPQLNKVLKGSASSAHMRADAGDCSVTGMPTAEFAIYCVEYLQFFDQIISEYAKKHTGGWVHIGLADNNRFQLKVKRKKTEGYPLVKEYTS